MNSQRSRNALSLVVLLAIGVTGVFVSPVRAQDDRNGLSDADRAGFYHTPEGSEIFPLDWMLALKNAKTKKLFLDDPERYGLLPEKKGPKNPYGLPVGLTAAVSRDTRFASIEMVGVNCAAPGVTRSPVSVGVTSMSCPFVTPRCRVQARGRLTRSVLPASCMTLRCTMARRGLSI